jgi:hypothetical protein
MTERRTFVVRVRDAGAVTVEDVDRRETPPLGDLHELPAWIERRLDDEPHLREEPRPNAH